MLLNLRVYEIPLRFQAPTQSLFTSILSKLLQTSILLSFFVPSTKTNHYFPPQEGCGNKYSPYLNWKLSSKKRVPNDPNSPFSREGNVRRWRKIPTRWPMEGSIASWPLEGFYCSVALERFHCLVANGRFYCLVALGRFHCLVANGRKRRNTFSPFPTFPPTNFT